MLGTVLLTAALQLAVIYAPMLNPIFHTQPLPLVDLVICVALSSMVLVGLEVGRKMVDAQRRAVHILNRNKYW